MTLYIRTEANRVTATGHMMRCLAIADAAAVRGISTVFIVAETCSERFPVERGYRTICLNRQWDDFDGEIPVMEKLIEEHQIGVLLIDSYFVTRTYMEAVTAVTKTAYIDDLHAAIWPCSTLINYAVYYDKYDYHKEYSDTKLLLGCEYAPLRKEFVGLSERQIRQDVKKILVVTGGTDEYHFMKKFTEMLLLHEDRLKGVECTLICGTFNKDLEEIKMLAAQTPASLKHVSEETDIESGNESDNPPLQLKVLDALPTLKDVLLETDLLITAGGTTLYEMAACGTPGICFSIADNQLDNVEGFAERDLVLYAGDLRNDFSFDKLLQMIMDLMQDYEKRSAMSKQLRALVDGHGAERIVDTLLDG